MLWVSYFFGTVRMYPPVKDIRGGDVQTLEKARFNKKIRFLNILAMKIAVFRLRYLQKHVFQKRYS